MKACGIDLSPHGGITAFRSKWLLMETSVQSYYGLLLIE
jgi:hypothetical protein